MKKPIKQSIKKSGERTCVDNHRTEKNNHYTEKISVVDVSKYDFKIPAEIQKAVNEKVSAIKKDFKLNNPPNLITGAKPYSINAHIEKGKVCFVLLQSTPNV